MPEAEDKYSRFFREHNIDIEAIEEAAFSGGQGGASDHGALTGLSDDDHTQYHNDARGDARYYTKAQLSTVATSGQYNDLSGKPTIPVASDEFPSSVGQFNDAGVSTEFSRDDHTHNGIPQTMLTTKGDIIVAAENNDAERLGVGTNGQALVANSSQTTGVHWARVDRSVFPIEELGLVAANGNPESFRDPSSTGSNGWFVAIYVPAGRVITGCLVGVHTAGTIGAGGENGFAIYDATGTQIGVTTSDDALFGTAGLRSKNLNSTIAASSSGRIVYVEMRREGWSVEPFFAFLQTANNAGMFDGGWPSGIRRSFINGGTGHPASINPATHGSTASGYMPFIGLY